MKTEFEIVFTNVNHKEIIENIKQLNWICVQENILMKRIVFANPVINKGSYKS
jgi:hypothetical protein